MVDRRKCIQPESSQCIDEESISPCTRASKRDRRSSSKFRCEGCCRYVSISPGLTHFVNNLLHVPVSDFIDFTSQLTSPTSERFRYSTEKVVGQASGEFAEASPSGLSRSCGLVAMSFLTSGSRSRRRDNHRPVVTYRSVWPVPRSHHASYRYFVGSHLLSSQAMNTRCVNISNSFRRSILMSVFLSNPLYGFIASPVRPAS
jgi:hypothetical protein